MSILVTGGWGYVGSVVVSELLRQGVEHRVCDAGWFLDAMQVTPRAEPCDLRNLGACDLQGVKAVIHLAGLSNDPLGALDPADTEAINHLASVQLARAARDAGVGVFVFASSASVYGESGPAELDEFAPAAPITPYARAKRAAEIALVGMARPGFRVAVLRGATAYGFSPCPRTDLLLNEFAACAALGRPLWLQSDGSSWRPFMPVADFARALVAAALAPPLADQGLQIWNIAPPALQFTVAEAVRRAAAATGAPAPVFGTLRPVDRRSYRIDGRRFAAAWPKVEYSADFDATIRETVAGFAALPTLEQDIARDRFVRLAMLDRRHLRPARSLSA